MPGAQSFFSLPPEVPRERHPSQLAGQPLHGAHGRPVLMFPYTQMRLSLAAIAVCAMMFGGCASWQGPRIDPTGERFLTWPNQAPPGIAAPPGLPPGSVPIGPPVAVPPPGVPVAAPTVVTGPPVAAPLPFGNVQAPPVYSDPTPPPIVPAPTVIPPVPYAPGTAIPGTVSPPLPASTLTPAVPIVAPVAGAPPAPTTPPGSTFVRLTPDRLVAPVGSEVFLKAGRDCAGWYLDSE